VTATPLSRLLRPVALAAALSVCLLPTAANAQSLLSRAFLVLNPMSPDEQLLLDERFDTASALVVSASEEPWMMSQAAAQTDFGVNKARFDVPMSFSSTTLATASSEWSDYFTITEAGKSGVGTMKLAFDFDGTFSGYPSQATFTAYVYSQSGAGGESFAFDLTTLGSSGRFETDDITFAFGEAMYVRTTLELTATVNPGQFVTADFFNTVNLSAITPAGAQGAVLTTASGSSYYDTVFNGGVPAAAAVPEPGTFALAGLGALALVGSSTLRRRRNASPAA